MKKIKVQKRAPGHYSMHHAGVDVAIYRRADRKWSVVLFNKDVKCIFKGHSVTKADGVSWAAEVLRLMEKNNGELSWIGGGK